MNFEQPTPEKESNPEKTNEMQIKLALRFYGFDSDEKVMNWIQEYSPQFREVINQHPKYMQEYEHNPEETLDKIEREMYEKIER